ncbi:hypothetical protein ACR6C2_08505 [Streptomyces sp. INA 01156]
MAGKDMTAYRLAFRLHHGREPEGRMVGTCRIKRCVAGAHLEDNVLRAAKTDWSLPSELPVGDVPGHGHGGDPPVPVRAGPWPPLALLEARFAFRFANPDMSATELARRLGLCADTVQRYRKTGAVVTLHVVLLEAGLAVEEVLAAREEWGPPLAVLAMAAAVAMARTDTVRTRVRTAVRQCPHSARPGLACGR